MIEEILQKTYFNNQVIDYARVLLLYVLGSMFILIIKKVLLKRLKALSKKTETSIDDFVVMLLRKIALPLAFLSVLIFSIKTLTLHPQIQKALNALWFITLVLSAIRFMTNTIQYLLTDIFLKGKNEATQRSVKGMLSIFKTVLWGLGIVLLLDNLGFKISTVIAGLGIGGVAVALAAQAILGDLFSYFAIFFDRPFEIGDFIIVGDLLGTVEHIGIKTTRVRSLGGEQLVFSNTDLTNARVRNYKRMEKRRVVFKLGVVYQTSLEKTKEIPKIIKHIIENTDQTLFDRAHFFSFADFSLVYEVVYYVLSGDYNLYMDIQQKINFAIKEEFEKHDIEFAYPTQTLFVSKE